MGYAGSQFHRGPNYLQDPLTPLTPTVYLNTEQTCENVCPEGETGDPIEVTIPAGTYSSTVSQEDADTQAHDAACAQAAEERALNPCQGIACGQITDYQPAANTQFEVMALTSDQYLNETNTPSAMSMDGKYILSPIIRSTDASSKPILSTRSGSSFSAAPLLNTAGAYELNVVCDYVPISVGLNGLVAGVFKRAGVFYKMGVYWPSPGAEPVAPETPPTKHFSATNASGTVLAGVDWTETLTLDIVVRRLETDEDEIVTTINWSDTFNDPYPVCISNCPGEEVVIVIRNPDGENKWIATAYKRTDGVWGLYKNLTVPDGINIFKIWNMSAAGNVVVGQILDVADGSLFKPAMWDLSVSGTDTPLIVLPRSGFDDTNGGAFSTNFDGSIIFGAQAIPSYPTYTLDDMAYWTAEDDYSVQHSFAQLLSDLGFADPAAGQWGVPGADIDWAFVWGGGPVISGNGRHFFIPNVYTQFIDIIPTRNYSQWYFAIDPAP